MYRHKTFTFESAVQTWLQTILYGRSSDFHDVATRSPAAALPQFLRLANEHGCTEAGLVAVAALVNIGACRASSILECFQQFNPDGSPEFEAAVMKLLMPLVGPRGPYMLKDLHFARTRRIGPVHEILRKTAMKNWSIVFFVMALKRLWCAFLERVLRPESGYVKRVLLVRCQKSCA